MTMPATVTRWRDRALADPRRGERTAALLGIALGACFLVCFLTGLLSHLIQHPPSWFEWPARPAGLYRITQGVHVATGIAAIPLLFAKLWTVYPRLFQTPVVRDVAHAVERLSIVPLVGGALFLLVTGVANIDLWYPWPFFFPAGHYWMAWVTIGALIVHIGAKATVTRTALRRSGATGPVDPVDPVDRAAARPRRPCRRLRAEHRPAPVPHLRGRLVGPPHAGHRRPDDRPAAPPRPSRAPPSRPRDPGLPGEQVGGRGRRHRRRHRPVVPPRGRARRERTGPPHRRRPPCPPPARGDAGHQLRRGLERVASDGRASPSATCWPRPACPSHGRWRWSPSRPPASTASRW